MVEDAVGRWLVIFPSMSAFSVRRASPKIGSCTRDGRHRGMTRDGRHRDPGCTHASIIRVDCTFSLLPSGVFLSHDEDVQQRIAKRPSAQFHSDLFSILVPLQPDMSLERGQTCRDALSYTSRGLSVRLARIALPIAKGTSSTRTSDQARPVQVRAARRARRDEVLMRDIDNRERHGAVFAEFSNVAGGTRGGLAYRPGQKVNGKPYEASLMPPARVKPSSVLKLSAMIWRTVRE